jgi:hypothetical protein
VLFAVASRARKENVDRSELNPRCYETKGRACGKLPGGKVIVRFPRSRLLRGISESGDEPGVGFVEFLADTLAKRVEVRSGRFL